MLHERLNPFDKPADLFAFPSPGITPRSPSNDAHFAMTWARHDLQRHQANLARARLNNVHHAIRYWEDQVCLALDAVWEAQENWKAVRRHWS